MMSFTEGTIVALLPFGFRIETIWGSTLDCSTMTPGHRLALAVGDRVRLTGGIDAAGVFATSSLHRILRSGAHEEVLDRPLRSWWSRLRRLATGSR